MISVTAGILPKDQMWEMSVNFCIFGSWRMKIGEGITFKWISTMETGHRDRKWIIVRIDGKIAAVSTDYRMLARISEHLTLQAVRKPGQSTLYGEISATAADFDEVWKLRQEVSWDDLMLFGTDFQKKVWKKLWELTHTEGSDTRLVSYTDFAELCQNRAGVRAVAHALGLNPISVIIPCHLVIPKEGIDKIREIHNRAQSTIFKGDDLCIGSILADTSIDFGEYALGKTLKRELIIHEMTEKSI
jgi:O-6-methylguanine DNA methyltransferase